MREPRIPLHLRRLIEAEQQPIEREPVDSYSSINLLALLFRNAKSNANYTAKIWADLMRVYVKDPRVGIKQTSKARSSEESNLRRGLSNPGMTVKNFVRGLRVMRPRHTQFRLTLSMRNGEKREYVVEYSDEKLFSKFHNRLYPDNFNFLRMFWDMIYQDLGLTEASWKKLVTKHLDEINTEDKANQKSSERSNLRRGLNCANMTIRIFTKALCVLNPAEIGLAMTVELPSGGTVTTEVSMEGNSLLSSPFDEEDDDSGTA